MRWASRSCGQNFYSLYNYDKSVHKMYVIYTCKGVILRFYTTIKHSEPFTPPQPTCKRVAKNSKYARGFQWDLRRRRIDVSKRSALIRRAHAKTPCN